MHSIYEGADFEEVFANEREGQAKLHRYRALLQSSDDNVCGRGVLHSAMMHFAERGLQCDQACVSRQQGSTGLVSCMTGGGGGGWTSKEERGGSGWLPTWFKWVLGPEGGAAGAEWEWPERGDGRMDGGREEKEGWLRRGGVMGGREGGRGCGRTR